MHAIDQASAGPAPNRWALRCCPWPGTTGRLAPLGKWSSSLALPARPCGDPAARRPDRQQQSTRPRGARTPAHSRLRHRVAECERLQRGRRGDERRGMPLGTAHQHDSTDRQHPAQPRRLLLSRLPAQREPALPGRGRVGRAPRQREPPPLTNARGTLTLALSAGDCTTPGLSCNGTTVTGSGTWTVVPDTAPANAYRGASGSGSFTLASDAVPGTGRLWSLNLTGNVTVLKPQVSVTQRAYRGGLGNYLMRTLSVEYRICNTGTGDASPSGSSTPCSPAPGSPGSARCRRRWVRSRRAAAHRSSSATGCAQSRSSAAASPPAPRRS